MWKMFGDNIECDECGGPGPPPKFLIPPPPRPPSLQEFTKNCNEEDFNILNGYNWENDMCDAIPIMDGNFNHSQSLQTSVMIAVFSLLLVLVVLISSLFVWKNKRKVQNFLPCKTPTRGPHINGNMPGGHSVTYEDPDAHLGHRPLVIRHHNIELLHPKSIHYPSGYPMTRSPPFLVSSSPGPDPYRSNDNVYEELGPGRDSDGDSDPPLHSDDDFAEDELSLPGERSFNKSVIENASSLPVSTIYHERISTIGGNGHERNSLLSSSSSNQNDATTMTTSTSMSSSSATTTNNNRRNGQSGGILSGVLRHTTGRRHNMNNKKLNTYKASVSTDDFNTSSDHTTAGSDIASAMPNFDNDRSYNHTSNNNQHHCYNTLDNDVERRNRINNQLSHPGSAVSTIFRERINYSGSCRYPQPYYMTTNQGNSLLKSVRSRTNPRSADRRRVVPPMDPIEPAYCYAEPVFHEGYFYDSCLPPHATNRSPSTVGVNGQIVYSSYVLPDYSSSYRALGNNIHQNSFHHSGNINSLAHAHVRQNPSQPQQILGPAQIPAPTPSLPNSTPQHIINHSLDMLPSQLKQQSIYSRDSSLGSDSGYSNHTSSIRGGVRTPTTPNQNHQPLPNISSLSCSNPVEIFVGGHHNSGNQQKTGLSFSWKRQNQKDNNLTTMAEQTTTSLQQQSFDLKVETTNSQNNNNHVNDETNISNSNNSNSNSNTNSNSNSNSNPNNTNNCNSRNNNSVVIAATT